MVINNAQGAYLATDYLISRRLTQPGYLKSFVPLRNFDERWEGFQKALRANGMHAAHSIVHTLAPTIEGAMTEMLEVLDRGDPLANCYFAENDLIAIGAMKAFKQRGYRIPEDIAIVGFDNISEGAGHGTGPDHREHSPHVYGGRVAVALPDQRHPGWGAPSYQGGGFHRSCHPLFGGAVFPYPLTAPAVYFVCNHWKEKTKPMKTVFPKRLFMGRRLCRQPI